MRVKSNFNASVEPYTKSPLRRVTRKAKCAICDKPDWCSSTTDGALALCMRVSAGSVKQAANGAYVHILRPNIKHVTSATSATRIGDGGGGGNREGVGADHLNTVYSYLFGECLTLTAAHGDHLLIERGLSDTTIAAKLYASMPLVNELPRICAAMQERFGEQLNGVPGFYKDDSQRWKMPHCDGFFIPVRDSENRVVGAQIRHDGNVTKKYRWFSTSPDKFPVGGASSGTPLHFVNPDLAKRNGLAVITEGALKSDCIAERIECAVIGLAGVNSFNSDTLVLELQQAIPELRRVVIAFDADWQTKKQVRDALKRLIHTLKRTDLTIVGVSWDDFLGKGLDDYLTEIQRRAA